MKSFMANLFLAAVSGGSMDEVSSALQSLIQTMIYPLIGIASAVSAVYGIYLGWKFWQSGGDEGKRKDAKTSVLYFVIGIVVIFAVIVGAPLLITALQDWVSSRG